MNGTQTMKTLLYEELELIARTSSALLRRIRQEHWAYRPAANMRTLQELAQHLALVPSVDLLILKERSESEIRETERRYAETADAETLVTAMEEGLHNLKSYMDGLSEEQFLQLKTTPFYINHAAVQAKWLIEIVTHAQHHRAQLFTYLKQLGYEVNMFDLY